jgi:RimJ/RimL family protein N-acetyltransferase
MPAPFEPREVVLRDGRRVRLRAISSGDEEEILQAFDHLSAQSRYMRFMATVQHLNEKRLRSVLASFPEKGFALAATVPAEDGIDIVGAASLVLEDAASCEFAISIIDGWGGAGLGSILLGELVAVARGRGLKRMRGFVLADNESMLRLARRTGFEVARNPDDFGTRLVTLELA